MAHSDITVNRGKFIFPSIHSHNEKLPLICFIKFHWTWTSRL